MLGGWERHCACESVVAGAGAQELALAPRRRRFAGVLAMSGPCLILSGPQVAGCEDEEERPCRGELHGRQQQSR